MFNGGGAVLTVFAVRGAGDAVVVMVSDAAGQRAWRCPGHVAAPAALLALATSRQTQVMARVVIRTIYRPFDTVATREDAERGRLLQAGLQRPSLPVLLPLMRLDLARPVR